jgi:hypothetical protein
MLMVASNVNGNDSGMRELTWEDAAVSQGLVILKGGESVDQDHFIDNDTFLLVDLLPIGTMVKKANWLPT